jgi:hypothetical protein
VTVLLFSHCFFIQTDELRAVALEEQINFSGGAVAMLGDDQLRRVERFLPDTTCAVAGGLAGILYGTGGTKGIPEKWIAKLARIEWITVLCNYFDKRIHDSGK